MSVVPTTSQSWLFVPPLDLPLALRLDTGRFGMLRPQLLPREPSCDSAQVISADDPLNPTGEDAYFANALHEAVDLESTVGSCVYAAYAGRVVEVKENPAQTKGSVTIDHHPEGLGFVTKYIHITGIRVREGEFVHKGEPFAQVSAEASRPTLHLELWAVIDRDEREDDWPKDNDMVPIDPTRALYAWEERTLADEPLGSPEVPVAVGVTRIHTVPFFFAAVAGGRRLHVPLYEPVTEGERLIVAVLRDAHRRGRGVLLHVRASAFWGVDVVTQAELA